MNKLKIIKIGGGINPMNKPIGSVEEKFIKSNHRYFKSNDMEKNLYYGCLLAQARHKDKVNMIIRFYIDDQNN